MLGGKCMEEKSNNQVLLDRKHVKRSSKFQMLLIAVTILAIALATGINAMQLHQVIQQETRRYVKDVSTQLAGDIDKLFVKNLQYLQALGDSFASRIQFQGVQQAVSELGERARKADYSALIYVSPQGEGYSSDPSLSGFVDMPGVQDSLEGKNGVSFLEGQSVLYTIPVEQDGKALGVLGGVRSKVNMQKVIRPRSFGGQGLTCILNQDGEVIISPTDLEPFLRLEDIFMKGGDAGSQVVQDIRQMQENMKNNVGGVFSFTAADNSRLVLAYDTLQTYNWVLLTLVPANLITQNTDVYVTRTILITAITLVLSGGILIALNRMFKGYNRRLERIAFVDELTGALSSAAFQMKCRVLMNDKTVGKLTVVAVNVKEFKLFNERFGSEVGSGLWAQYQGRRAGEPQRGGQFLPLPDGRRYGRHQGADGPHGQGDPGLYRPAGNALPYRDSVGRISGGESGNGYESDSGPGQNGLPKRRGQNRGRGFLLQFRYHRPAHAGK